MKFNGRLIQSCKKNMAIKYANVLEKEDDVCRQDLLLQTLKIKVFRGKKIGTFV